MIPCPKSTRKERLWENANVAGFHITDEDMEVLNGLHDKHTTDW